MSERGACGDECHLLPPTTTGELPTPNPDPWDPRDTDPGAKGGAGGPRHEGRASLLYGGARPATASAPALPLGVGGSGPVAKPPAPTTKTSRSSGSSWSPAPECMLATSCARTSRPYSPTSPQLEARIAGGSPATSTGEIADALGGRAVRDGSRLDMGGVTGIEGVAKAEAGVDGCGSPRSQRSEESEKRLRGRGSSVVGLKECTEEASRSEEVRNEAEPPLLSRFLLACGPPLEAARVRVSDDFDLGGLDMSAT